MIETNIRASLATTGRTVTPDTVAGLAEVRRRAARHRRRTTTVFSVAAAVAVAVAVAAVLVVVAPAPVPSGSRTLSGQLVALSVQSNGLADVSFSDATHGLGLDPQCTVSPTADTVCVLSVVRTDDGGRVWRPVGRALRVRYPDSRGSYPAVAFATNGTDGWIYGVETFVTHNGGKTFAPDGTGGTVSSLSIDGDTTWAVSRPCVPAVAGCPAEVVSTATSGGPWRVLREMPALTYPYLQLLRPTAADAYLAAQATSATLEVTDDGGVSWVRRSLPAPCVALDHLAASTGTDLWALCTGPAPADAQVKELFRSDDGGRHWALVATSGPGAAAGVGMLPTDGIATLVTTIGPHHLWIALDDGPVLSSSDGGRSWTSGRLPGGAVVSQLSFSGPRDGWVLAAPGDVLYRTANGGRGWTRTAAG